MSHKQFMEAIYPHRYRIRSGRIVIVLEDEDWNIEIRVYAFTNSEKRQQAYDYLQTFHPKVAKP